MRSTTRYLDFPDLASDHSQYFRSILIYDPPSSPARLNGVNVVSKPLSISAEAMWIELPRIFSLISVSQIQICVVNGYGELSVQTAAAKKHQRRVVLAQGSKYKQDLQPEELIYLKKWRDETFRHIANNQLITLSNGHRSIL